MSSPRSVRFESSTLAKLTSYASRHPGMTSSSAAALLVEEGLRMDSHPGVVFREGPAGRRAGLVAGPDVWEVIRAVRQARASEPELSAEDVLRLVADGAALPLTAVQVAVSYYAAFPDEVDAMIDAADAAEVAAEAEWERARQLLAT